jgi:hypothetical protein
MHNIEDDDLGLISVRAKFIVTRIDYHSPTSRTIVLKPVYSDDPTHENKQFWDATPSGELTMTIQNPRAAAFFVAGQEYYLDFTHPVKSASLTVREEVARQAITSSTRSGSTTFTLPNVSTP